MEKGREKRIEKEITDTLEMTDIMIEKEEWECMIGIWKTDPITEIEMIGIRKIIIIVIITEVTHQNLLEDTLQEEISDAGTKKK